MDEKTGVGKVKEELREEVQEETGPIIPVFGVRPGGDHGAELKELMERTRKKGWEWGDSVCIHFSGHRLPRAREILLVLEDVNDFLENPEAKKRVFTRGYQLVHLAEIRLGKVVVVFTLRRDQESGLYSIYRWVPGF